MAISPRVRGWALHVCRALSMALAHVGFTSCLCKHPVLLGLLCILSCAWLQAAPVVSAASRLERQAVAAAAGIYSLDYGYVLEQAWRLSSGLRRK